MCKPRFLAPDCLACGACCHTHNPRLVELLGIDLVAVPPEYIEQAEDGGSHMRMIPAPDRDSLVCAAMGPGNACKIYSHRPFLCREFERGSRDCEEAIEADKSFKSNSPPYPSVQRAVKK